MLSSNVFSKLGMSVGAVTNKNPEKGYEDIEKNPKILYVTEASSYKTKSSNDTIKYFSDTFMKRKNLDKEIWLFGIHILGEENERSKM